MDFDLEGFLSRLKVKATSKQEAAKIIYEETRAAENQKLGFLDQASENPDFYKNVSSQADSYIAYLKVMHNELAAKGHQQPDEEVYILDKTIIDQTLALVKQLEQIEHDQNATPEGETRKTSLYNMDKDS